MSQPEAELGVSAFGSSAFELLDYIEVPISAIEHYSYCQRQCGLILVESIFEDNLYTVRGELAHERVHSGEESDTRGVPGYRDIPLWSDRLGLFGKSDLVEMRSDGPYPVEYKVGRHVGVHAELQLCAQALCLEEMLGVRIERGAIFFHAVRRREEIAFDSLIRAKTEEVISGIRQMLRESRLPDAVADKRCPNCSLIDACLPNLVKNRSRLGGIQGALYQPWSVENLDP